VISRQRGHILHQIRDEQLGLLRDPCFLLHVRRRRQNKLGTALGRNAVGYVLVSESKFCAICRAWRSRHQQSIEIKTSAWRSRYQHGLQNPRGCCV
jgi:hypothetical protein